MSEQENKNDNLTNKNESEKLINETKKISNFSSLLQKGKNNPLLNMNLSLLSNKDAISNLIQKKQNESQKTSEQKTEIPTLNYAPKSNYVRGMRPSTLSRTIKVQQQSKINLMEKLIHKDSNENISEENNEKNNIESHNRISNSPNTKNIPMLSFSSPPHKRENQLFTKDNNNQLLNEENSNYQTPNINNLNKKKSLFSKISNDNNNITNSEPQNIKTQNYIPQNLNLKTENIQITQIKNQITEHINMRTYYSFKQCNAVKEYSYLEDQNIANEETMEDKGKSIENFMNDSSQMLFMLFDGHGGDTVSKYLQNNFSEVYKDYLISYSKNNPNINYIENALKDTFNTLNNQIRKLNLSSMGSTACIVHLIWENPSKLILYCANCGDTRASLINSESYIRLSKDHRADDKDEKKRIIKSGGMIINKRVMGALMLTRAFGDFELSSFGVIECPFVSKTEVDLNVKNQFLIIACDGIWDLNSENEFQEMIIFDNDTQRLCQKIIKGTLRKDAWDNLSVFCVKLT